MDDKVTLTDEHMDFLREAMNIGAGNAATALSQLLQCDVDIKLPILKIVPAFHQIDIFKDPSFPVVCVKMGVVGDAMAEMLFVIPEKDRIQLVQLAEKAITGEYWNNSGDDLSALSEIGNIVAGVYLTAIHDFCKIDIYHSVPVVVTDMFHAVTEELIATMGLLADTILIIENEFEIVGQVTKTYLMIFPTVNFITTLIQSMKKALLGGE